MLFRSVAGGFAYVGTVVIVEDVVAYLEDYAEVLAEAGSSLNLLVGGSRRQRTNGGTRLEERSGLTFYYIIVDVLRDVTVGYVGKLQDFTV